MNKDEWMNLGPLFVTLLAPVAAKYGLSASDEMSVFSGLIGIGLGVWQHWNQIRVPENSTVIRK